MHIAVVYQYYHNLDCPGAGRHYTFSREWARKNAVTLVTTDALRPTRVSDASEWVPPGVNLTEFHVPYRNRMGRVRRLWPYVSFARAASGWRPSNPVDVIVGSSTPLSAAWAARRLARRLGVPWVMEVRDLWPDFPIQMGAVPFGWLRARLRRMEIDLYRTADHVVVLSPDMRSHVLSVAGLPPESVSVVAQGTNPELAWAVAEEMPAGGKREHRRAAPGDDLQADRVPTTPDSPNPGDSQPASVTGDSGHPKPFSVLYAGMLGRANAIPELLETAARLRKRADIVFRVAGYGLHADRVREYARLEKNVAYAGAVSHRDVFRLFRSASVSIVAFSDLPVLRANAPSKLFDSLVAGTPVIVTTEGWMKDLVESEGLGWYAPSTPDALSRLIERLADSPEEVADAGRRGLAFSSQHFDRRYLAATMLELLEDVVDRRGFDAAPIA